MSNLKTTFIIQLPTDVQLKIQEEVAAALHALHQFSEEAYADALAGRLSDIEDLIDITPFL